MLKRWNFLKTGFYEGIIFENPSALFIFENTGILNAYYLPRYCRSGLYPGITPVNSFRIVFNSCFSAEFDLLPDETYWPDETYKAEDTPGKPIDFSAIGR